MININGSVFVQIINFLVLIWALNIFLFKPIRKILAQRNEKVSNLEQSIQTFKENAEEKDQAYSDGIRQARARGLKEKESLIREADEEEKRIVAEINEKSRTELDKVRSRIAKDAEGVKSALQKEIDTFAMEISQKILGRSLS